ncbi:NAD(P)/FAD-dependent oxidoreductase [Streptacidiphilus jiangxiensis]|uniref:Dehydrogenase (Flavoprotein) n=1 Tax=Streptacidiphilus jiangxiensis TaxID=235985 RepID=A0A1H7KJQ8_STRJI|nr:FAD-dependent oxidoreductase [Streptacidiphilus jiangxiensis]SEK87018.1 Dehydrogenase (flavoprotein) [Streptacidiphilus jiangxiensis]
MTGTGHAVVLGAGFAGLLAAAALADHAERVTLVERDVLPAQPPWPAGPFCGVPQARHGHLLLQSGATALERLLPGFTAELSQAGARRLAMPGDLLALTAAGWLPRTGEASHAWSLSRNLLDSLVRTRTLRRPAVTVLARTRATGLVGDARRVTGVRLRSLDAGTDRTLAADLVVDATGRGSAAPRWLEELGLTPPTEERVDCGLVYATQLVQPPEPLAHDFPSVSVQTGAGHGPGRSGVVFPIEDGRWLVSLSGTRGAEPGLGQAAFHAFARALPSRLLADLLELSEPLDRIHRFGNTADRRRRYDRLVRGNGHWPEGFVVVGDAVGHTNPSYGHGLSVAALGIAAFAAELDRRGLCAPGLGRRVQQRLAVAGRAAWTFAVGQDLLYPGVVGASPTTADLRAARLGERLHRAAFRPEGRRPADDALLADLVRIGTLTASPAALLRTAPRALLRRAGAASATASGAASRAAVRVPAVPAPPLTAHERSALSLARAVAPV